MCRERGSWNHTSFHMSGKSQTIGDLTVFQPSQILPTKESSGIVEDKSPEQGAFHFPTRPRRYGLGSKITISACNYFNSSRFVQSIPVPDTLLTFCFTRACLVTCKSAKKWYLMRMCICSGAPLTLVSNYEPETQFSLPPFNLDDTAPVWTKIPYPGLNCL